MTETIELGSPGDCDQSELVRRVAHVFLVAALALTGHDAEAREALQRYLALPSTGPLKTIAAWKAYLRPITGRRSTLRRGANDRTTACARPGCRSNDATRRLAAILAADVVGYYEADGR